MQDAKRVLVTGGAGLVGSALGRAGTTCLTRAELDITDASAVARCLERYRPQAVINAAAQARVDLAETETERTLEVNAHAPGRLAAACSSRGIRLVHLSTDYVFTGPDLRGHRLRPGDPTDPRSTYARSKLLGEQGVMEQEGVVVRVQWVYRPGHPGFFTRTLEALGRGESVRLVTDQVGCPTPTIALVPALLAAAAGTETGCFHFACTGEASAWQWLEEAARHLGLPLRAEPLTRAQLGGAPRPARSCLDSSAFTAAFGTRPESWRVALRRSLEVDPPPWA